MIKNPTLSIEDTTELPPFDPLTCSEETKRLLLVQYTQISNNDHLRRAEKLMGLKSIGCSEEECEWLCRPKEIDREQVMRDLIEIGQAERRALNKERRKENKERALTEQARQLAQYEQDRLYGT